MENEIFDEARRCTHCGIVTYCDNCPICGKTLPRSNSTLLKIRKSRTVAGEEDIVLQPVGNQDRNDLIANRRSSRKKRETLFEKAEHIEPRKTETYRESRERKEINNSQRKNTSLAIVLSFVVLAVVLVVVLGEVIFSQKDDLSVEWKDTTEDYYGSIEQRSGIEGDRGEIETSDYSYLSYEGESILSIENTGERSFLTDVYLYDDKGVLGYYEQVYMLPHESFDLSIYTDRAATSFEFKNYEFYENDSTMPDFDYESYNDYGSAQVEVERLLEKEELEILVIYLYNASRHSTYDVIHYLLITTPYKNSYEVYISEDEMTATVYELDRKGDTKDSYEIKIGNTNENSIGVSL